jgi:hypothetical protein
MTIRIGKCIVHNGFLYEYKENEAAFRNFENGINIHPLSSTYLYTNLPYSVCKVNSSECLFVYKDEFEKYPEYFI